MLFICVDGNVVLIEKYAELSGIKLIKFVEVYFVKVLNKEIVFQIHLLTTQYNLGKPQFYRRYFYMYGLSIRMCFSCLGLGHRVHAHKANTKYIFSKMAVKQRSLK